MSQDVSESLYSLSPDKLDEWMRVLVRENIERIQTAAALTIPEGHFDRGPFVEAIFSMCTEFQLPREVCYLASDLFERFMQEHLTETHRYVRNHAETTMAKNEWTKVVARICSQVPLRLLSCCQIASKFVSVYKHLSGKNVTTQLRRLGHKYSEDAVSKSEARVLKTVGYRIEHSTPIVYVDLLLAKLSQIEEFKHVLSKRRSVCLDLLDILLVDKQKIYQTFAQVMSSSQADSQSERLAICAIERDYMFLAASIIAASSFIVDQNSSNAVIENLSQISEIDSSHIVDMSSIILRPFATNESRFTRGF